MIRERVHRLLIIVGVAAISAAAACERSPKAAKSPSPDAGSSGPLAAAPKAIAYFQSHCASCHGPYARFAGPQYSRALSDAALIQKVEEMAAGPGKAPLDAPGLAAQTAYHRSLVRGEPYVSLTSPDPGGLAGEVTPGAAVELVIGGERVAASVQGHEWSHAGSGPVERIIATLKGKTIELDPARHRHSHAAP